MSSQQLARDGAVRRYSEANIEGHSRTPGYVPKRGHPTHAHQVPLPLDATIAELNLPQVGASELTFSKASDNSASDNPNLTAFSVVARRFFQNSFRPW